MENQRQSKEQDLGIGPGEKILRAARSLAMDSPRLNRGGLERLGGLGAMLAGRESARINYQSELLRKAGGVPWKMRSLASAEARANGFTGTAASRKYNPSMALRGDGRDHLRSSAYWTSQLHFMREHGLDKIDIGNRTYTRAAVAAMSIQHANVSVDLTNKGQYDKDRVSKEYKTDSKREYHTSRQHEGRNIPAPAVVTALLMQRLLGEHPGESKDIKVKSAMEITLPANEKMIVKPSDHDTREALSSVVDSVAGSFQQSMEEINAQHDDISLKR